MGEPTEMVERVAKATCQKIGICDCARGCSDPFRGFRDDCGDRAMRAIAAMREPTEAMLDATDTTVSPYSQLDGGAISSDELWRSMARDNWEAMIAVALSAA